MSAAAAAMPVLRAPRPWRALGIVAAILFLLVLCAIRVEFDPTTMFGENGREQFVAWWERFRKPDFAPEIVDKAWRGALQTLAIAFAGTSIGALIGFVLLPFACSRLLVAGRFVDEDGRRPLLLVLHHAARLTQNALRTVPYLVWAIFFVLTIGLGPFPGALAIGLHTGGVLGRLFATAADDVPAAPLDALRQSGSNATGVFWWGMIPSSRPALVSYFLYHFEVNVREAAVLGIVGAGGLGQQLWLALNRFDYEATGTYLGTVMILVLTVDWLSAIVRRRLL